MLPNAILCGVGTLALISYFSHTWLGEIVCSFKVYYSFIFLVACIWFAILRKSHFVALSVLFLVLNSWSLVELYESPNNTSAPEKTNLTLMQVNVDKSNRNFEILTSYIRTKKPDVVAVEEYTPECDRALRQALPEYRYVVTEPRTDYFGIALYSKIQIVSSRLFTPKVVGPGEPAIISTVRKNNQLFQIVAVHVYAPHRPQEMQLRDEQLRQIADAVKLIQRPTILLGDLNTTPWSSTLNHFLSCLGLKNGGVGFGIKPTCCIRSIFWIPIDYCLIPCDAHVGSYEVGPIFGSDHCPLFVTVDMPVR